MTREIENIKKYRYLKDDGDKYLYKVTLKNETEQTLVTKEEYNKLGPKSFSVRHNLRVRNNMLYESF